MNRFVLENTFIKIYLYHILINIFIKTRSQSRDRAIVQNKLFYGYRESIYLNLLTLRHFFLYGGSIYLGGGLGQNSTHELNQNKRNSLAHCNRTKYRNK